jgi:acetylornithine deacetylase/succinyl-diaminopimelate desuccinylase-like protein
VVPADPADWSVHPFSGEIRDGVLWGRGAVDMKNADAVLIALAAEWARSGRRPQRDIVLAFTADEEDTAAFGAQVAGRTVPGAIRGLHRGHRGIWGVHLPRRGGTAALPDRLGRAGHRLAEG